MTELWLSRARLRRDTEATAALARLLVPDAANARAAAAHRLVWALFADAPDRTRDFLWREEAPGRFMTLSARPPIAAPDLFEIDMQTFAPVLTRGDRLEFSLRANPTAAHARAADQRGKRHDVVMHALHALPKGQRAAARLGAVAEAGRAWLARQGETHGFVLSGEVGVDGYEPVRIARDDKPDARFSRVDFSGVLTVENPHAFLPALATGFGRARAFGCGLMLIRRA